MRNAIVKGMFVGATFTGMVMAQFEITRHTIDSGGVVRSTGAAFELSGTIGQPDAGVLTGGEFQLSGGFWIEHTATDCNDDGTVDLIDHEALATCLTGPDVGIADGCECLDVDRSGMIDLHDVAAAQSAHVSQ